MTKVKHNCVMHWNIAVTPIHFNSNRWCFTSIVIASTTRKPWFYSWKNCKCTNLIFTVWTRYCNCRDITLGRLNSWKLPGCFSYGLETRLIQYLRSKNISLTWFMLLKIVGHNGLIPGIKSSHSTIVTDFFAAWYSCFRNFKFLRARQPIARESLP